MVNRKARLVALAFGIGLAAILLATLASWRFLLVAYYAHKLEADPEYAWTLAGDEASQFADEALGRFLSNARGRDWLLDQLWTHLVEPPLLFTEEYGSEPFLGVVFDEGTGKARAFWKDGRRAGSSSVTPADYDRSRRCFSLLGRVTYSRLPVPSTSEWLVTVKEPAQPEFEALGLGASFSVIPEQLSRYIIVRRIVPSSTTVADELVNSMGMRFVRVKPGVCAIEGGEGKRRGLSFFAHRSDGSASRVRPGTLSVDRRFWIGRCEVRLSEFERVVGRRPSANQEHWSIDDTPDRPAWHVSREEAQEFCSRLSRAPEERAASRSYRLPTLAEWAKHAQEVKEAGPYRPCFRWVGHYTVLEWTSETDEHGDSVTGVIWSHPDPHSGATMTFRVVVEKPAGSAGGR